MERNGTLIIIKVRQITTMDKFKMHKDMEPGTLEATLERLHC